jgi:hypothetical protein
MNHLKSIWRAARLAAIVLGGWLAMYGAAWAQKGMNKPEEVQGGGSYVAQYALVIIVTGLGVFFVARSSRRRDRARPEEYAGHEEGDKKEPPKDAKK